MRRAMRGFRAGRVELESPASAEMILNRFMDWSGTVAPFGGRLGRRIVLWFLVLSMTPLIVSGGAGYLVSRRIIDAQTRRYLTALTEVEAQHVAGEVERHRLALQGAAIRSELVRRTHEAATVPGEAATGTARAALSEWLRMVRRQQLEAFDEVFVVDADGRVLAGTRDGRLREGWHPSSRGDGDGFPALFEETLPDTTRADGQPGSEDGAPPAAHRIGLMTTIIGQGQTVQGALAATVDFRELSYFVRIPQHIAGDIHTYIIDQRGQPVLVSHAHSLIDYEARLPSPLVDQPTGSVSRYRNYEGADVLGVVLDIPEMPWRYISEVYIESAFGTLRRLGRVATSVGAAFALLLLGTAWIVARSIVTPLRSLSTAADRIRGGDLGFEVNLERDDELGDLGRTFDQMSRELRDSSHRLQELHDRDLRRAAQLASVGELASGIAHEIKNPIVGIASGLDLLSRDPARSPRSETIVSQLREQVTRMEAAIRDLLSYAKPKEPRLILVDPRQLIDRVSILIRPQADSSGVHITTHLDEPALSIRMDPELLTQALVNLALNAVQAMPAGGELRFGVEHRPDSIHITVSDTGPGIPADRIDAVFRPFVTTKHSGTGLGLAISRGIVERHGGRLTVESTPGGAVFSIELPLPAGEDGPR
jgi:signal transduction histidine kinase